MVRVDNPPATDDADIDTLLGATFAKVGPSPTIVEASRRLNAMLDAARGAKRDPIDPRTLPVRFSRLHQFAASAAHYYAACQRDFEETLALRMGAGFHASLFENRPVVCYDGPVRSGKPWERFEKAAKERNAVVLNEREFAINRDMVDAVRKHDRAMDLLFDGTTTEQKIEWSIGERACRATPDAFRLGRVGSGAGSYLVELKSARITEPRWIKREALKRHYHAQLAWYEDAIEAFGGRRPEQVFIVAVENAQPHNVTILSLPDKTRERGMVACRAWFELLRVAEATGIYGPYVETDIELVDDFEESDDFTLTIDGEELSL